LATLCYSCHKRQHPNFLVQRIKSNKTWKQSSYKDAE
jgi:hypothetical protein